MFWVMRQTSGARWASDAAAAGGRGRRCPRAAAVEKIEEKRKPDDFFGNRKVARSDNPEVRGSSPLSATNNANRKRYRFEKPRNHSGFGVFCAIFQGEIQKISFPQNDLWGGLELKKLYRKSRLTKSSNIFFRYKAFFAIIISRKGGDFYDGWRKNTNV